MLGGETYGKILVLDHPRLSDCGSVDRFERDTAMKAMILGEGTTIDMIGQDRCPNCEWIEITTYGQPEPEYIRGLECEKHRKDRVVAARAPKRSKPKPPIGITLWIEAAHELDQIDRHTGLAYELGWRPLVNYRHRILINQFAPDPFAVERR